MAVFEKLLNLIFSQHSPDKQTSLIFHDVITECEVSSLLTASL